ncbi:MAG TPA: hypothetical protein DIU00_23075 [Phycisphaerales bacterium]|nr:hypothetical protein [Phycisphaerales bacterium]
MTLTRQQKIATFVLAIYWPALFILTHIPIPGVIQEADVSDKSLHFLAYLILAFLLRAAVSGEQKVSWRKAAPWLVLFVIVVYGILDEWLQSYVVGRSSDIRDFFADMVGTFVCLILCSFLAFWSAGLIVTATVIFSTKNIEQANLAELLPVTNAVFHLFAYAILTVMWIRCTHLFLAVKAHQTKWLIPALAGPTGFLLFVKLFSVIVGKDITLSDTIISFGAITTVVTAYYLRSSFQKKQSAENGNFEP